MVAAPDEASLREAALKHLAKYATTQAGLRRVLDRRIDRWVREQPEPVDPESIADARQTVRTVVARLAEAGAVDDGAFAAARTARLGRTGHSRRAIAAHLAAKGVDAETARAASVVNDAQELAAAVTLAFRRRIGPFRAAGSPEDHRRELGVLARAGFPQPMAEQALGTSREEAEKVIRELRERSVLPGHRDGTDADGET